MRRLIGGEVSVRLVAKHAQVVDHHARMFNILFRPFGEWVLDQPKTDQGLESKFGYKHSEITAGKRHVAGSTVSGIVVIVVVLHGKSD